MSATNGHAPALDAAALKKDFPVLSRLVRGKPLVYLDNAATTQKPASVIDALTRFYRTNNANVHRGVHKLSEESTEWMEAARRKTAAFIGVSDPAEIIFTRGTTEAINLVATSWARKFLKPGDEIVLSELEHHSNIVPWQIAAQATGAALRWMRVRPKTGELEDGALSVIGPRTKLVAVSQMSNALGTLLPLEGIIAAAKAVGALVLVDGAQSVPHGPVSVASLGCDFLAFSGHKMLGPTGVGVLWARRALLESMDPYQGGGDMIAEVHPDHSTWNELPYKFEAGTPNYADIGAFGAALDYLNAVGMDAVRRHEMALGAYARERLSGAFRGLTVFGPEDPARRGGLVSFNWPGLHPHDVGTVLDGEGVAVRVGHHCCQILMKRLEVPGTVRASFYLYNTHDDVDALIRALGRVEAVLRPA